MRFFMYTEQIKAADKNFYRLMVIITAFLCVSVAVPVYLYITGIILERTLSEQGTTLLRYDVSESRPNQPSDARLSYLSDQLNTLKERYAQSRDRFLPAEFEEQSTQSSLAFKELLFTKKQALMALAKQEGIVFPEEYGLHTYEQQLPTQSELPQLFFYVRILDELLTALIRAQVQTIDAVDFSDAAEHTFSKGDSETYLLHTVTTQFTGTIESLTHFVETLARAQSLYIIRSCELSRPETEEKKLAPDSIAIDLDIDILTLPIENKEDKDNT